MESILKDHGLSLKSLPRDECLFRTLHDQIFNDDFARSFLTNFGHWPVHLSPYESARHNIDHKSLKEFVLLHFKNTHTNGLKYKWNDEFEIELAKYKKSDNNFGFMMMPTLRVFSHLFKCEINVFGMDGVYGVCYDENHHVPGRIINICFINGRHVHDMHVHSTTVDCWYTYLTFLVNKNCPGNTLKKSIECRRNKVVFYFFIFYFF